MARPRRVGQVAALLRLPFAHMREPGKRGQSLVEFAIILPAFMLLLLIAVDFGRVYFSYVEVRNAAREGAAYGAANPTDTAGITTHARQETNAQKQRGENAITVTAVCKDQSGTTLVGGCAVAAGGGGIGNTITVNVIERFNFITPLIGGLFGNFNINATASSAVLSLAASGLGNGSGCIVAPTAAFTVNGLPQSGSPIVVAGLSVTLDAAASTPTTGTCAISGYNWDLGDGLNPNPPVVNTPVTYTYARAGTFTIQLQVTNPAANATATQLVTVGGGSPTPSPSPTVAPTASPAPTATPGPTCNYSPAFTYNFTGQGNGAKKHEMTFNGTYTGQPAPTTWTWNFGDNTAGSGQIAVDDYNAAHASPGITVTLTIKSAACPAASVSHQVVVP